MEGEARKRDLIYICIYRNLGPHMNSTMVLSVYIRCNSIPFCGGKKKIDKKNLLYS